MSYSSCFATTILFFLAQAFPGRLVKCYKSYTSSCDVKGGDWVLLTKFLLTCSPNSRIAEIEMSRTPTNIFSVKICNPERSRQKQINKQNSIKMRHKYVTLYNCVFLLIYAGKQENKLRIWVKSKGSTQTVSISQE